MLDSVFRRMLLFPTIGIPYVENLFKVFFLCKTFINEGLIEKNREYIKLNANVLTIKSYFLPKLQFKVQYNFFYIFRFYFLLSNSKKRTYCTCTK